MTMTPEEAKELIEKTYPDTVDGATRPTEHITVDMPYNEDMPQLFSGDYVAPDQLNLITRQLLSNGKAIVDGTTPVAKATQADNCTGNSVTATKLKTARTISLTGAVTGSGTFDGSANVSIATTGLIGKVEWYAGNNTPDGYLLCDGSAVSRTSYAKLYAVIGTTYGAGDGSTTFNLPCLTDGRFIEGSSTAGTKYGAGLPNIYGTFCNAPASRLAYDTATSGAFSIQRLADAVVLGLTNGIYWIDGLGTNTYAFYASASNSIYGSSSTVQPTALTLRPIIKYA